ncbi:unnamed protein product [Psylliodes chrysocephalus]|uniref:Uncharacterized protein n=1 Tax=Psylliodes chrysocephalus TaxID=3402493 RepID=A0A9P0D5S3_9CUCU|nr:unnamed protein product [Psylliodes chrysocephala]
MRKGEICLYKSNEIRQPNIQQDPIPIIESVYNDEVDIENGVGNGENIRNRISREAVLKVWIQNRIFCNLGNRSCPEHFENGYFSEESVALLRLRAAPRQLTHGDNECLINLLTDRVVALKEKSKIFDFDNENMDDDYCKCLTGLKTRSSKKLQEAPRSSKKLQEAPRSSKKLQEAPRSSKKLQEAARSSKKPQEVKKLLVAPRSSEKQEVPSYVVAPGSSKI